jgi:hypothetical protein
VAWGILCLLSSLPGMEMWQRQGGWPAGMVSYSALGAAIIGGLTLIGLLRAFVRTVRLSRSSLHLSAETRVLGWPLEGAIAFSTDVDSPEFFIRLVCEKHILQIRKTSKDKSRSREIKTEYTDAYRGASQNGLIPVRFGIPFDNPETSTDWIAPVFLWFEELEDLNDQVLRRFWVPVFKTPASDPEFELGAVVADRLMSEESPDECLKRHGITVSGHSCDDYTEQTTFVVPAGQAWSMAIWLGLFGGACLAVAGFALTRFFASIALLNPIWSLKALVGVISALISAVFVMAFGLAGLLFTGVAFQALFERRQVECDSSKLRIHKSYVGLGWTASIPWEDVKELRLSHSSSTTGQRRKFSNVVAVTDGMQRRNGSILMRRRAGVMESWEGGWIGFAVDWEIYCAPACVNPQFFTRSEGAQQWSHHRSFERVSTSHVREFWPASFCVVGTLRPSVLAARLKRSKNSDATDSTCNETWPRLRKRSPTCKFKSCN